MSKRKKPLVYLTPELRAYYEMQLQYYREFNQALSERSPVTDQSRMLRFIDRINVSQYMCAIWYRYPAAVSGSIQVTHSSTMVVALAKGVSSRLEEVMQAVCEGIYANGPIVMVASAVDSKASSRLGDTASIRDAVNALTPAPPRIAAMDVIFNREKYFAVDSMTIELIMPDTFEGDMFERLMEFDRAWERITQALEFVTESLEFERRKPQPCN